MRYTRPLFDMLLTTLTQYLKLLESAFLVSGPERFSQGVQRKRGSSPSCFSRYCCFQRRQGVGDRGESGRSCKTSGLERFRGRYPRADVLLVGAQGIPLEEFFSTPIEAWLT